MIKHYRKSIVLGLSAILCCTCSRTSPFVPVELENDMDIMLSTDSDTGQFEQDNNMTNNASGQRRETSTVPSGRHTEETSHTNTPQGSQGNAVVESEEQQNSDNETLEDSDAYKEIEASVGSGNVESVWPCPISFDTYNCAQSVSDCIAAGGVEDGGFDCDEIVPGGVCCSLTVEVKESRIPCPTALNGISCQLSWVCIGAGGAIYEPNEETDNSDDFCEGDNVICCASKDLDTDS